MWLKKEDWSCSDVSPLGLSHSASAALTKPFSRDFGRSVPDVATRDLTWKIESGQTDRIKHVFISSLPQRVSGVLMQSPDRVRGGHTLRRRHVCSRACAPSMECVSTQTLLEHAHGMDLYPGDTSQPLKTPSPLSPLSPFKAPLPSRCREDSTTASVSLLDRIRSSRRPDACCLIPVCVQSC